MQQYTRDNLVAVFWYKIQKYNIKFFM